MVKRMKSNPPLPDLLELCEPLLEELINDDSSIDELLSVPLSSLGIVILEALEWKLLSRSPLTLSLFLSLSLSHTHTHTINQVTSVYLEQRSILFLLHCCRDHFVGDLSILISSLHWEYRCHGWLADGFVAGRVEGQNGSRRNTAILSFFLAHYVQPFFPSNVLFVIQSRNEEKGKSKKKKHTPGRDYSHPW